MSYSLNPPRFYCFPQARQHGTIETCATKGKILEYQLFIQHMLSWDSKRTRLLQPPLRTSGFFLFSYVCGTCLHIVETCYWVEADVFTKYTKNYAVWVGFVGTSFLRLTPCFRVVTVLEISYLILILTGSPVKLLDWKSASQQVYFSWIRWVANVGQSAFSPEIHSVSLIKLRLKLNSIYFQAQSLDELINLCIHIQCMYSR